MTKLKYIAYLFFPLILLNYGNAFPQCGDSIDLGTWVQEGIPANGNWTVTGGGNAVNQTINGEPTFYVSPDSFINVIITGDIRVATTGDDDWVGFVFGYNGPDTTDPANYDFYLFDWKQNDQNFGGFFGAEGYSLSRVNGPVVNLPEAFSANAGPFVDLIDSQYGNNEGWNDLQTYSFALTYTNTRAVIAIDGDTIFDVFGCFPPGRFGFYNYSQSDVEYSNFSYRVAAAFEVVTPDVCLGDSARFIALSDSCFNAAGVPLNNTLTGWFWDFGDGNTSTDTNGVHLYNAPGTYEVSLEVTDYLGCKDTAYSTVNVYDVSVDLGNDTSICIGDTVTLDADTNALTYNWSTGEITQTIEVTDSGSYSVIVVGGGGCSDTDTVVVSNIALPVVDLGNDTSICNNDTLVLYAGNPGAVFLWNDGSALDSLVLNDSGTYWVEVLYPSGCSNRDTAVITNYAQPVVSPPNPSYCYGDTISVSAAGANTYTWFPAVGISSTVGTVIEMFTLVDTLYSVIGIDTNGCTDTSIFTVDVLDLPTVSITGGDSICDGDSTELVLSFTGLPPFDVSYTLNGDTFYRNNITAFQDTFAVSDSGMYTPLSVSDGQCSNIGSDSTYVYLRPLPTLSFQSLNDSICFRDSIAISAMGADQYLWTPSAGLNDSAAQTVIASPSATTLYTANGTDQFGCSDTASFLLEVLPLPILQRAATPNPVCSMDTVTLGASGAQSYYWISSLSNDTLFGDTVFDDPINHVNYFLTGTDSFGCSDTLSINVMVDTLPVVSILPQDTVFCLNDSAQLSAFGANTYEWQPSTGLSDSVTANVMASPTSTSAYQVVGTDLNGCKGSDSVVVNIWDLPTVVSSAATDEICIGDTLTITASGAATYYWTPNYRIIDDSAANSMVYPEGDTSYVVFGTDSNGCENIDTFDVTVHPLPIIELSTLNDSICLYDSTTIVATGAVSYDWVSIPGLSAYNQALVSAFPVTTTSYEVLGTDINGCVSSNDTVIRVLQLPHIVAAPAVGAICVGESQPIRLPGNYSYVWSPTDSLVFDGNNNDTVVASPLDTTTYNILATDFFGCQSDTHYTLAVTPLPVITTSIDDSVICPGVPTTIHVTGNYSFEWSPIYYLNGVNSANPTVAPQNSRSYYVTATGPGDCQSFDTVDVAVWPTGPYSAGGDTVMCEGDTVQFGASGGVSYSWSPSIGLSNTSIPDPMCYSKANRFYYVEITDSNGCKSQEAVFITVNDLPFASVGNDKSICFGDSVWIGGDPSGPAGASFEWTPATGLDGVLKPNPNAKPDTSTTYSLTVTNQEGCTRLRKMRVTVNDLPSLEVIELPSYLCDGDTQNLYVTAGLSSYSWSPSEKLSRSDRATTSAFIDETTMFNVVGEDENGCKNSISFTLPVEEKPFVNIRGNLEMCIGDTVQFDAKADTGTLSWEPADLVDFSDSLNPKAFPTNVTTFTLNIMSDLGCRNKDEALVFVHQLPIADAGEDTDNCDMSVVYVGSDVPTTDENEWFWSPGEKLDNPTALRPKVLSLDTDTFVLSVTSPEGCFNSDTIVVNSDCYRHIYAPNAFTPDGDGYNDFFKIVGRNIYNTHLVIYDRWGHVLFQSKDLERGWDGKDQVKGNDVQIGAYFWQMTFETEMGRQLSDKGKVNLIR